MMNKYYTHVSNLLKQYGNACYQESTVDGRDVTEFCYLVSNMLDNKHMFDTDEDLTEYVMDVRKCCGLCLDGGNHFDYFCHIDKEGHCTVDD